MEQSNYLTNPINFSLLNEAQEQELEMSLIRRVMYNNGWDFPTPDGNTDEYDMAVEEVKWYITQLKELAK